MNDWKTYIKGKKVTVMGLGLLGRGIGDITFLAEEGAELIVTDLKTEEQLASSLEALKLSLGPVFNTITFILGEHRLKDFKGRDFILKAAGVPLDSPYITEARKNNIPIEMSSALFAAFTPATVIGVTGTRGKSTVTFLLHEIVKDYFSDKNLFPQQDRRVFLGGNVKGISTLQYLKDAKEGDVAVLELDSWQLQGFGERKISPHISIFTTFFSDHLNYYKNHLDQYLLDKVNIFANQNPQDFLIAGNQVSLLLHDKHKDLIKAKFVEAGIQDIPEEWNLKMPGEHNRYNAGLALKAAEALGIPVEISKKVIESFAGVPGRLELRREYNGITIYNDTNSTTPDAALVALKALGKKGEKKTIMIMGGADKNLDMSGLLSELPHYTKKIIVLPGTGTQRIMNDLNMLEGVECEYVETLSAAITQALDSAEKGDALLLSPAFASFGLFKNEYDRGDQFNALIDALE